MFYHELLQSMHIYIIHSGIGAALHLGRITRICAKEVEGYILRLWALEYVQYLERPMYGLTQL